MDLTHKGLSDYWALKKWTVINWTTRNKACRKVIKEMPTLKLLVSEFLDRSKKPYNVKLLKDIEDRLLKKLNRNEINEYENMKVNLVDNIGLVKGKDLVEILIYVCQHYNYQVERSDLRYLSGTFRIDLEITLNNLSVLDVGF